MMILLLKMMTFVTGLCDGREDKEEMGGLLEDRNHTGGRGSRSG